MKRKKDAKAGERKSPAMKWQKDAYKRQAEYRFILPYPFLLLCKLMEVTPEEVLTDFMDNLGCGSWKREGREKARERLVEYFIAHGYGQQHYSEEERQVIFQELDAIGMLWPLNAKMEMIELHSRWRDAYYHYWFQKWLRKPRNMK